MNDRLRIIVKDDRDSSLGRGGYLVREHFEPRMAVLVEAIAKATEYHLPEARTLRITEGWRPQRDPHRRDLHTLLRAFDFTISYPSGGRASMAEYTLVANEARATVGDHQYDFEVHGEGLGLHIHAEFDPR